MYNKILSNPLSFSKPIPSGASHQQNFSSDSDAIDSNKMPIQIFLKFPGGRITALEFPEVAFLPDVKRSLSLHGYGCKSLLNLQNGYFLRQGRALSVSHPIHDGDIISIVPRLLGGVTPRGQPEVKENQEPNLKLFSGFAPFNFDEPFGIGNRYARKHIINANVAIQLTITAVQDSLTKLLAPPRLVFTCHSPPSSNRLPLC